MSDKIVSSAAIGMVALIAVVGLVLSLTNQNSVGAFTYRITDTQNSVIGYCTAKCNSDLGCEKTKLLPVFDIENYRQYVGSGFECSPV